RLDQTGQLRVEEVEEWAGGQLGDAATAGRLEHPARSANRPLVEAFDELDPLVLQERADETVHEPGMNVADVGVDPGDDVALQDVEAFPEGLALARIRAVLRQDVLVDVDGDAEIGADLARPIGRTAVDQDD